MLVSRVQALGEAGATSAPRILLVDDDEVVLLLTALALRERGFFVTEAQSGEQALQILSQWSPDIIVLDALMPGLDGFSTCAAVRTMPGFDSVPILMLTGLDDDASITQAYEAGATDFYVKATQWSLLAGRLLYLLRAARTRAELASSKSKLARAQDLARMGSFEWLRGSSQLEMSVEGLRIFGCEPNSTLGLRQLFRMVAPDSRGAMFDVLRGVTAQNTVLATDIPINLLDMRQRIVHVEAEPEFSEHGHTLGYTGIVQDVTERRRAEDRILHLANFDWLTGLPNRRQLLWRADRALDSARRMGHHFALLLIDLDRFKVVNDTLGHPAGDELLQEVSRRLRKCVRHCDDVLESRYDELVSRSHRTLEAVGRLGGDEFIALLPEVVDEHDAGRVAQRMLEAMREPVRVYGQDCFVTASVGVALYPRDGSTVAELMRNSDVAMYAAKSQGKNAAAIYGPQLAGRGREKLQLEGDLHKALERNELVLHYQPKIDVRSVSMLGVEALMRWQRGDNLLPPADFLPLAEETGLIVPMSEWALRQAAQQAKVWQRSMGFDGSIAVNLPSRMFERGDLVECIHSAVTSQGVPHRAISLEIIEDNLMKDLHKVIPALHRLNEIGVEIAIDDFGTGYSSLSYLTSLPITELKIDRSFVHGLSSTPQSVAVVTAIIALARSLGLRVVAEGVETIRQMEVLHGLGCVVFQGFAFSRAVQPEEIERWIKDVVIPGKADWIVRARALQAEAADLR